MIDKEGHFVGFPCFFMLFHFQLLIHLSLYWKFRACLKSSYNGVTERYELFELVGLVEVSFAWLVP